MKKRTIWIVAVVMGISFITLFVLQAKYLSVVMQMRREQFEESVARSLYQAARNLELSETKKGLEAQMKSGKNAGAETNKTDTTRVQSVQKNHSYIPANVSKGSFLDNLNSDNVAPELRDTIRERYLQQRALLNEVVYSILYKAAEKPLDERIDFVALDNDLRAELRANGIDIDYHFYVMTSDGREVYRCSDYEASGNDYSYRQVLYPNDPSSCRGLLHIHFPDMQQYIFTSVRFMVPALIFTLVLLVAFIFTIYSIFRQKRLTEIKNDFINNMTHELKTPISGISLAAQMLNDTSIPKSEAMLKRVSGVIIDESKRLRFLVEKVLQISMFDRKATTFKPKEVDANMIISDTVNTFRLKVEATGGTIDAHLDADNAFVYVDEMHFTNVIFNLLDNAVKYKAEDRALRLFVATRNESGRLTISIADNGIGIKREDLRKIFERFYRVHTGDRHDVKGFGLGLAYVHSVVKALDGAIHAESEYGKGTRFVITLPIIGE